MCAQITLVIGGASSGKSSIAEKYCHMSALNLVYLATAQVYDDEMRTKVERHRTMRTGQWQTIEDPFEAAAVISDASADQCVLLDCATLWLTNHLLAEHDMDAQTDRLCTALQTTKAQIVIVTNEVGMGIVPENALARRFRIEQGQLNQRLASQAQRVIGVMAGLPFALKGDLPLGLT